jgi:hypothetical protein
LDVLLQLREEGTDGLELTDDRIKFIVEVIFAETLFSLLKKFLLILFVLLIRARLLRCVCRT